LDTAVTTADQPGLSRRLNITLTVISFAALFIAATAGVQTYLYADCQGHVNEALIVAQLARAQAAEQDRQSDREESTATADLIRSVFAAKTQPEVLAAYRDYQTTMNGLRDRRNAADAKRRANPLPPPPSATCG
jgi:hypothetical protein